MKRTPTSTFVALVLGLTWTLQGLFPHANMALSKFGEYEAGTIKQGVTAAKLWENQFVTAIRLGN